MQAPFPLPPIAADINPLSILFPFRRFSSSRAFIHLDTCIFFLHLHGFTSSELFSLTSTAPSLIHSYRTLAFSLSSPLCSSPRFVIPAVVQFLYLATGIGRHPDDGRTDHPHWHFYSLW